MSDKAMSTRIVYTVEGEHVPYRVTDNTEPQNLTLALFKTITQRFLYRFFFLSFDQEFGTLKEEVTDEDVVCPSSNGLVQAWLTPLSFSGDTTKLSPMTCTSNNMTGLSENTGASSNSRVISGCSSSHSSAYRKSTSVSCGESFLLPERVAGGFMTSSPSSWVNTEEQRCRSAEMYREYERLRVSREVLSDTCAEIMARGHWNYGSIYERRIVDSLVGETHQNASAIPAAVASNRGDPMVPGEDAGQVGSSAPSVCDVPSDNLNQAVLHESEELVDQLQHCRLAASADQCNETLPQEPEKQVPKKTKLSNARTSDADCLNSDELYPSVDTLQHTEDKAGVKMRGLDLNAQSTKPKWKSLSMQKQDKDKTSLRNSSTNFNQNKQAALKVKSVTSHPRIENKNVLYSCGHDLLNSCYQTVSRPCSFCENVGSVYQNLSLRSDQPPDSVSTTDIFSVSPLSHSVEHVDPPSKDLELYDECTYKDDLLKEVRSATDNNTSGLPPPPPPPPLGLNPVERLRATSPSICVSSTSVKKFFPRPPSSPTPPEHVHRLTQPLLHPHPEQELAGSGKNLQDDTDSSLGPDLTVASGVKGLLQKDLQQTLAELQRPCCRPEIQDRTWLGCTIPNAVIGSELIAWLRSKKDGLESYIAAKNYAQKMLDNRIILAFLSSETRFIDEWYYTVASGPMV